MKTSQEHLSHLLDLLKLEREEDMRIYKETVLDRSLKERVQKGTTWFPAPMKRMYIGLGEHIIVEVERAGKEGKKNNIFQVGGAVALFGMLSDQEVGRASGVVAAIRQKFMRISLNTQQIPDWLTHAELGIDLDFDDKTYKEMVLAVKKVQDAPKNDRLGELRETLLGTNDPEFYKWNVTYHNSDINTSQNKAVQRALEAKDIAIIHGPPGTGKTTTLVQAIKEILRHEHQVLVCAPSNTAVDLLTLKLTEEGVDVVRLGNPARVEASLLEHTVDGMIIAHEDYPSLRKLRKEAEEFRRQALKYKRNFGPEQYKRRKTLLKEARELKQMAHKLEDYILHRILNRTQVIAATLTGASSSLLGKKRFHTVCIDEAAQALEPACWIPMLRADRVIMAGDHCQLPPTVKSFEADKKGLGKTLFESVIDQKPVSVMLEKQYRMNEKIMQFSGQQFYHNRLVADASVKDHQLGTGFPPVEFVDTAGCGFDEHKNPETLSTANPDEADLLLRHLALLLNKLEAENPEGLKDDFSVGIISPYKAQVAALREQLTNSPMLSGYASYITINTVDGFQGQEREVIYISLVRSNRKGEIGFLADIRRMNVALTRARKKLVVFGDSATLGKHTFYQDFLNYVDHIQAYRSAWEFQDY